ncbi:MAG: transcription termination/antitermination factor NusG [Ignavibacteria bacterium GWF2_33_9]|nr:MAG: transcription termination/antitermination factor NusG [Ignavibacteria bacterium GWF2_33_9]
MPEEQQEEVEAKWYALRTYTAHENKVKAQIEAEVKRLGIEEKVVEIVVPEETVFEVRNGKRRTKVKNFLPGYIVLKCILNKKLKDIIVALPSVVSFVGRRNEPTALQQIEVDRILGRVEERKDVSTIETAFQTGDPVRIIDGPFNTFLGTVKEVNLEKQKLKVEVGILGRKTPVELDFTQVEMETH